MKKRGFSGEALTMDPTLQDIVENNRFESTTRYEAATIEYPRVMQTTRMTLLSRNPRTLTDVLSLRRIPSQSSCQDMKKLFEKGKYAAVSCDLGTITLKSIEALLKIHSLRNVKNAVENEQKWLKKQINVPNTTCSYSRENLASYAKKFFNTPNNYSVLGNNRCILASDLATIAGTGWLNFSIIPGIAKMLQRENEHTAALILNNVVLVNDDDLPEYVRCNIRRSTKYVSLFANVGKTESGKVFVSKPGNPGHHWTLLYVDLTVNKGYYCDTSCWGMPEGLKTAVAPIVKAIYEEVCMTLPKPLNGIIPAHVESIGSVHLCSKICLKNISTQTCANVCGVAVAVLGGIACAPPGLWRNVFLKRDTNLPTSLQWLLNSSVYSHFLRCTIILWLLTDSIDVASIGVNHEKIPPRGCDAPSDKEFASKRTDAQGKPNSGGEKNRPDTWIKVKYHGRKKMRASKVGAGRVLEEESDSRMADGKSDDRMPEKESDDRMPEKENDDRMPEEESDYRMPEGESDDRMPEGESDNTGTPVGESDDRMPEGESDDGMPQEENDDRMPEKESDDRMSEEKSDDENRTDEKGHEKQCANTDKDSNSGFFYVGQEISDLEQLEELKAKYEEHNFCELWKRDVRSLQAAAKRVPRHVEIAKPSLKYYPLKLVCKFGGKARNRTQRIRNTKTFRQECPFEVYLILSPDGQHLQVIRVNEAHNHVVSKTIYEHLPRQRASCVKENVVNIEEAIRLQANTKLPQQKVEETTGQKVTLKDISNIKQKSKKDINKNNLEDVIEYLKSQPGSTTEVIIDEENGFKGIFYQDVYMQNLFQKFPEIILVDATYKLLDLRMPVYLMMCIDGDGLSEIVAMFILAEETKDVIQATMEIFKNHNPSWSHTKVIMSDKDFVERDAFTSCFPGASLNICLYHTLRSFRREVTSERLGISSAERLRALEILSRMAHSKTSTEYDETLKERKNSNMKSVTDYVLQNWDPIKEQWVACFKDKTFNLGETTNNRLESTFSKLKSVCSRYASLMQFFSEFFAVLKCLRDQRNHHYLMSITRKKTEFGTLSQDMQLFCNYLTPYAFKFVQEQLQAASHVKILNQKSSNEFSLSAAKKVQEPHTATPSSCDCSFFTRMALPCKHIFKVRAVLNMPAFCQSPVHERWTMQYYESVEHFPSIIPDHLEEMDHLNTGDDTAFSVTALQQQKGANQKTLSQAQKFRKGLQIAQTLASLVSEGGMVTFATRFDVLESIVKSWQHGREVIVCEMEGGNQAKTNSRQCESVQAMNNDKDSASNVGISETEKLEVTSESIENGQTQSDRGAREERPTVTEYRQQLEGEQPWNDNNLEQNAENVLDDLEHKHESLLSGIRMSPKMLKRGRPKGAEVTVIGLPKRRKREKNDSMKPYCKLPPMEKESTILRSLTIETIAGKIIIRSDDLNNLHEIPDSIQDKESLDIYRVQKYFSKEAWLEVISLIQKKEEIGWCCAVCAKIINDALEDSIACDRCLLWSHFKCISLTKRPKHRSWFCKSCKLKFN